MEQDKSHQIGNGKYDTPKPTQQEPLPPLTPDQNPPTKK